MLYFFVETVQFVRGQRGYLQMVFREFIFRKRNDAQEKSKSSWRCVRKQCNSRCTLTDDGRLILFKMHIKHSHLPDHYSKTAKKELVYESVVKVCIL